MNTQNIIVVGIICFTILCGVHMICKAAIARTITELEKEKILYKKAFGIRDEEIK